MNSIEQIIADYKRKQEELEAKKVVMTRRDWIEYLPKDYKELIGGLMSESSLNYVVESWWDAIVVPGGKWEDRPFYKDDFWFQLNRWSKGESDHLPYIPGVRKQPLYFPRPEMTTKSTAPTQEPVKKVAPRVEQSKPVAADKSNPTLQPLLPENEVVTTEVYTTKHTIPYTGGELPLFASL